MSITQFARNSHPSTSMPSSTRVNGNMTIDPLGLDLGDAVERATHKSLGGLPLDTFIEALPAAIYMTDAAGHITFYNEAAAELWGCRPELGKSKFCGSWKLYWCDGRPLPHDECPMALVLQRGQPIHGLEAWSNDRMAPASMWLPIRPPYSMTRAPSSGP